MDKFDEIMKQVFSKEIPKSAQYEKVIKNALNENKSKIYRKRCIVNKVACLFLCILFFTTAVFCKEDLSNWYQKMLVNKSTVIFQYIPNNISKITYRKRTENQKEIVNFVVEKSDIDKLIGTLYKVKLDEKNKQKQQCNYNEYKLRIEIKGDNLLTLEFYEAPDKKIFVKLNDTNSSKVYQIDNEYYQSILTIADVKYYLHISNNSLPTENDCLYAKKNALDGLSEEEIISAQKKIRNAHGLMETILLDGVKTIKDANSPYWKSYTVDELFVDPYSGVLVEETGFFDIVNEINELQKDITNIKIKEICNEFCSKLQEAMDNHDLASCFEAHKILHDIDYWIINYPPQYEAGMPGPVDWIGVNCYFGLLERFPDT